MVHFVKIHWAVSLWHVCVFLKACFLIIEFEEHLWQKIGSKIGTWLQDGQLGGRGDAEEQSEKRWAAHEGGCSFNSNGFLPLAAGERWTGLYLSSTASLPSSFCFSVYVHAKSLQPCPTLCNPVDCGPPGSSVHGILQARILECAVMPSSWESSPPRDWICISCVAGWFFTHWAIWEAHFSLYNIISCNSRREPSRVSRRQASSWKQWRTLKCSYQKVLLSQPVSTGHLALLRSGILITWL